MTKEKVIAPPIDWRKFVYFEPWQSRRPLLGQFVWFLFWFGTTAFAIYLSADHRGHGTHEQLGLPPCPSAWVLNRPCPGCGLTTSFTAFVHGDIVRSFVAHPMGPFLYLCFTASALACFYGFVRKWKFNTEGRPLNRAIGWMVAIFLVFGGIRFALVADYNGARGTVASVGQKQS